LKKTDSIDRVKICGEFKAVHRECGMKRKVSEADSDDETAVNKGKCVFDCIIYCIINCIVEKLEFKTKCQANTLSVAFTPPESVVLFKKY